MKAKLYKCHFTCSQQSANVAKNIQVPGQSFGMYRLRVYNESMISLSTHFFVYTALSYIKDWPVLLSFKLDIQP